jgi:hypothetical protein
MTILRITINISKGLLALSFRTASEAFPRAFVVKHAGIFKSFITTWAMNHLGFYSLYRGQALFAYQKFSAQIMSILGLSKAFFKIRSICT